MRAKFFTIALFFASIALFAQQVPRENVILELGTATW